MNVIIIPGFMGYPEEELFQNLGEILTKLGHKVIKIAWPIGICMTKSKRNWNLA